MLTGFLECLEDSCSVLTVPTVNPDPHFKGGGASPVAVCMQNLPANAGDPGSIPGSGRSPGGGNSNPFQYSCLENSMNRGALWATVHGVARVGHNLGTKPPRFQIAREWQTNQSSALRELAFQRQLELITTPRA